MDYSIEETGQRKKVAKRLYTTKMIDSLRKDILGGFEIDTTPFFPFNTDLRNANITFKMTEEELEEYERCFTDAGYFIEKYCKFLTDHGRRTVKLRDYQHEIVDVVTSQYYDPEYDEMIPNNRNVCLLSARQSGKCVIFNELCDLLEGKDEVKRSIGSIYEEHSGKGNKFLKWIKNFLLYMYEKL